MTQIPDFLVDPRILKRDYQEAAFRPGSILQAPDQRAGSTAEE